MEDIALTTLRTMLGRRGLETQSNRVITDDLDQVNVYSIGGILVIFSQKVNGLTGRDLATYAGYAEAQKYTNGLILVGQTQPSDNVLRTIKTLASNRIQVFHIRQLQFDITTHRMAMPHRILKEAERTAMATRYTVTAPAEQLPSIDSQDIMVKWIGAVPGDIIEITRHSDVAGPQVYYRHCVADVNVA